MMVRRWLKAAILSLVLLSLLAWVVGPLKPFQDCIREHKNYHAYDALRDEPLLIVQTRARIRLHLACTIDSANQYQTALLVLSGILVAAFTGTLWWATLGMVRIGRRQHVEMEKATKATKTAAAAAQKSADALPALERAYMFLEISGNNISQVLAQLGEFDDVGDSRRLSNRVSVVVGPRQSVRPENFGDRQHRFEVNFQFVNHGKTPAIIIEISANLDNLTAMDEPSYFAKLPIVTDVVVPPGCRLGADHEVAPPDSHLVPYIASDDAPLTHSAAVATGSGKCFVWFYGRIVYEDVFGTRHTTSWWRRYNLERNRLVWHGDPKYNQRT